jgi:hypothetical protein
MTVRTKRHCETFMDKLANETILYGGLPLRRCDVYRDALERTGSWRAADMFAFGLNKHAIDTPPMDYEEFKRITGDC